MVKPRDADVFDRPEIFLSLGLALADQGKIDAVQELIGETLGRHRADSLYHQIARLIRTRKLPGWHDSMLRDTLRNAAYRRAIEAAAPGRVVLDIGTGSGLLAMIAARAGAERVIACEANPLVADTARRIVAANGLDDRIEIHACHSTKLDRSTMGGSGADLVVSEIFAADLVSEGVLTSLDHARGELAASGAQFIPEAACLRVALAEVDSIQPPPLHVEGLDIAAFAPLFAQTGFIRRNGSRLSLRSAVTDLARLDLSGAVAIPTTGRDHAGVTSTGGRVNAVAQWLRIDFGPGNCYENPPDGDEAAHWSPMYHQLPGAIATEPGEQLTIEAFFHTDALAVWASEPAE